MAPDLNLHGHVGLLTAKAFIGLTRLADQIAASPGVAGFGIALVRH